MNKFDNTIDIGLAVSEKTAPFSSRPKHNRTMALRNKLRNKIMPLNTELTLKGYDMVALFQSHGDKEITLFNVLSEGIKEISVDNKPISLLSKINFKDTQIHVIRYKFQTQTTIENSQFSGCDSMLEVKISDSITDLKDNAFSDCVNLQNVILNKGLKNIGDSAFKNTTKLSSITCYSKTVPLLADNVFSNVQHNGILTVPEDVNYLPWLINEPGYLGAYDWSVSYIPETKLLLDGYDVVAIFKADNATGSTKLWNNRNNDVTEMSIDGQPVDVVTQYNFNDTNEHIVRYRFKNEGSVPNFCFSACTQMYECKIAEGITIIGMYGFDYCRKLNHLVLPNTLQACGTWAFNSVKSLEIITFGENFRGIGDYGLDQNFALKYIICYAATAPKLDYNVFNNIYQNGTLFYPKGTDYSSWMSKSIGYLGNNKWKSKEFDKIITEEGE